MTNDISFDSTADHSHAHVDVAVYQRRCVDDQRSFRRVHLAADVTIDPKHVFKGNLTAEFWLRFGGTAARALSDAEGAAAGAQLSGNNSIDFHPAAKNGLTRNDGNARLKIGASVTTWTRRPHGRQVRNRQRPGLFSTRQRIRQAWGHLVWYSRSVATYVFSRRLSLMCGLKFKSRRCRGHCHSPPGLRNLSVGSKFFCGRICFENLRDEPSRKTIRLEFAHVITRWPAVQDISHGATKGYES